MSARGVPYFASLTRVATPTKIPTPWDFIAVITSAWLVSAGRLTTYKLTITVTDSASLVLGVRYSNISPMAWVIVALQYKSHTS